MSETNTSKFNDAKFAEYVGAINIFNANRSIDNTLKIMLAMKQI